MDKDLSCIEKEIKDKLVECEIWGDLGLSFDEYETLTQNIKDALSKTDRDRKSYLYFLNNYPATLLTQVINFILYNDENKFWDEWQESLDLDINFNDRPIIGSIWIKKMARFGFTILEDGGYKYLTPLICQAGVPNSSLGNLFYIVENTENQYFDPREIIDDLFSWRRYLLNKPIERYIRLHRDSAVKFILDIYEIVKNNVDTISTENNRIVEQYKKYKDYEATRFNSRKHGINEYIMPHLFFDSITKGPTIKLPQFPINNEYVRNLIWKIEGDAFQTSVSVKTLTTDLGRLSEEALVSVPCLPEYFIKVYDDINEQKPLKAWENSIEGFTNEFLIFDNRGKRVSGEYLPKDSGYILYKNDTVKVKFNNMMKEDLYLPEISKDFNAIMFYITNKDSSLEVQNLTSKYSISCRPTLNVRIYSDKYLFDENESKDNITVFTKFPIIEIDLEDNKSVDDMLIIIRNRLCNYKQTLHVSDYVSIQKSTGNIVIDNNNSENIMPYGNYEISFYKDKAFLQSYNFAYSPLILYDSNNTNLWPNHNSNLESTGFCYKPEKGIEIVFQSEVKENLVLINNEVWKQVILKEYSRFIKGNLVVNQDNQIIKIPFKKTVRNITWKFWNEDNSEERICLGTEYFDDDEFKNNKWWLTLDFNMNSIQSTPTIELTSKLNHIADINSKSSGKANIPMSIFSTTIENASFPIEILLNYSIDNEKKSIILAKISEKVLLNELRYKNDDGTKNKPYLIWKLYGKGVAGSDNTLELVQINDTAFKEDIDLCCSKANKNGIHESLKLSNNLNSGLFKMQMKKADDFFGDTDKFKPVEVGKSNTILVNVHDIIKDNNTISGLINMTLCLWNNKDLLKKVKNILQNKVNSIDKSISVKDIRNLITLTYNFGFINNPKDLEINYLINQILDIISEKYLNPNQRLEFLIELLDSDTEQEELEFIYNKFSLSLSKFSDKPPTKENVDHLSNIDNAASITWMLLTHAKFSYPGLAHKILNTIGLNSATEMLRFNNKCKDCQGQQEWIDCYVRVISDNILCTNYKIIPSPNIYGDTEDLLNIIDWGRPGRNDEPKLLLENKTDSGTEFCGLKYIDMLVSWFFYYKRNVDELKPLIDSLKELFEEIDCSIRNLDKGILEFIKPITLALNGRYIEKSVYEIFYYSGLSTVIKALHNRNKITDKQLMSADNYLITMKKVCPEIVANDLLLAELYMFFKERGTR
ncbi:MAG: hypothetical protein AB7V16_08315 [Vulcanibacillus sp.]